MVGTVGLVLVDPMALKTDDSTPDDFAPDDGTGVASPMANIWEELISVSSLTRGSRDAGWSKQRGRYRVGYHP